MSDELTEITFSDYEGGSYPYYFHFYNEVDKDTLFSLVEKWIKESVLNPLFVENFELLTNKRIYSDSRYIIFSEKENILDLNPLDLNYKEILIIVDFFKRNNINILDKPFRGSHSFLTEEETLDFISDSFDTLNTDFHTTKLSKTFNQWLIDNKIGKQVFPKTKEINIDLRDF